MIYDTISTLGRADMNPNGWIFFTIALYSAAIGLFPFYKVLHAELHDQNKIVAGIMVILYILTSVGLVMAGTFQEGSEFSRLHLYSAYFGFGGFFLAGIFTWFLMSGKIKKSPAETKTKLGIAFLVEIIVMCTGAGLFLTHMILHETGIIDFDGAPFGIFIGFSFTEWLLVITIFIDKIFMAGIVSNFMKD